MTNSQPTSNEHEHNNTTHPKLEPCSCRTDTRALSIKSHMDHGEFGCRERARYVYCSNCWACGPAATNDGDAIKYWNEFRSRATVAAPPPPMCVVHAELEKRDSLRLEVGNDCVACSLHERTALLSLLEPFAPDNGSQDSLTVLRGLIASAANAPVAPSPIPEQNSFQERVQPWMLECFGAEIAADKEERNHRFLEEALELVQSCGATRSAAHQLVDYVFNRPADPPQREVGGVMVTLAALCLAQGFDMHECGEAELQRVWGKIEVIRAKQAAKPKHSPLPEHVAATPATPVVEQDCSRLDNWPIPDVLSHLASATEHLLRDHNCDEHGWETWKYAAQAARKHAEQLSAAFTPSVRAAAEEWRTVLIAKLRELEVRFNWTKDGEVITGARQFIESQQRIVAVSPAPAAQKAAEEIANTITQTQLDWAWLSLNRGDEKASEVSKRVAPDLGGKVLEQMAAIILKHCSPVTEGEGDEDYAYAVRLATVLRDRFYADNQDWRPLDTINGVLSQIDNMIVGLLRRSKPALTFRIEEPRGPF